MSVAQIRDRFHMSEIVYSAMRSDLKDTTMTPDKYRLVDAMHALHAGVTVVIYSSPPLIASRWRDNEMYPLTQVQWCNAAYERIVEGEPFYDYKPSVDIVIYCDRIKKPFPNDDDARRVLDLWLSRIACLHSLKDPRNVPEPLIS